MSIRYGELKDLEGIVEIYNQAVRNTTASMDIEEKTYYSRLDWFNQHDENHPIFVYKENGLVLGWASLSPWSPKMGYKYTAEISIYVHEDYRGRGIGKKLMGKIVEILLRNKSFHTIIARIAGDNKASIELHKKYGFISIGTMKEVGYKFNQFIDVHIYQLII